MVRFELASPNLHLAHSGRFFLTRETGAIAHDLMAVRLREIAEGEPLVVLLPPDQILDASFADESVVRLGEELANSDFGDRCILLEGLTEDSITNIEAVIRLGGHKVAFLVVSSDGGWQVIGQLEKNLRETLELVFKSGRLTAPELADMLKLAINSASNRLKRLWVQRLVRRDYEISESGLQYIYYCWTWVADQGADIAE